MPLGHASTLHAHLDAKGDFELEKTDEVAWIEVIQKMDGVYSALVNSQTELERKNGELEEAQTFISSVLSSMTDVLIVTDRRGNIQQTNKALEQLTCFSGETLIGQPLAFVFHPDNGDLGEKVKHALSSRETLSDCELSLMDQDGNPVPLSVNCAPRFDHRGRMVGQVLIGRPVGELQKAYSELDKAHHTLRQAQRKMIMSEKMAALGRLVAGVAHELNNPISFVFGNMHALKTYGERITRYLQQVELKSENKELAELRQKLGIKRIMDDILPLCEGTLEGAERVSDIVQELRRFSSSQKEPMEICRLLDIIEKAANWGLRASKTKPAITIKCDPDLAVSTRKGYLHQILVNLTQNAIDAMESRLQADAPTDAEIVFICALNGDDPAKVDIAICDNGHGIADKDLQHIFEPFYTTRPIGQGTGLGLYVSYNLAEEMNGVLTARNRAEGGACFTLSLPAAPSSLSSASSKLEKSTKAVAGKDATDG